MFRIVEKRTLTPVTNLFRIEAPLVARHAAAGQFVMLRVYEEGERIPVTITDLDRETGLITIVVQSVGKTSRLLNALEAGDALLDLVGPLGTPAPLPQSGRAALIGGGFGAAAILSLAKELQRRGLEVHAIVGARTSELVILEQEVGAASDYLYICTDDGSRGYHGFVTGQLAELHTQGLRFDAIYGIGPLPMMRSLADTTAGWGDPTWVSLDPLMLDGTGMCGGCRVYTQEGMRFACIDGPFFDAHGVDYAKGAARTKMYREQEALALATMEGGAGA